MRIALISDTHNHIDPLVYKYAEECDEIWHAGDIGTIQICDTLKKFKPLRAVYGNIDGQDIRKEYPEELEFVIAGLQVYITHIGGYPGHYAPGLKNRLKAKRPGLFICGHSHILKVMPDKEIGLLHMNPGAAGIHGFHPVKTMLRFTVSKGKVSELQAIEMGKRA